MLACLDVAVLLEGAFAGIVVDRGPQPVGQLGRVGLGEQPVGLGQLAQADQHVGQASLGDRDPAQLAGRLGVDQGHLGVGQGRAQVAEDPAGHGPQTEQARPAGVVGRRVDLVAQRVPDAVQLVHVLRQLVQGDRVVAESDPGQGQLRLDLIDRILVAWGVLGLGRLAGEGTGPCPPLAPATGVSWTRASASRSRRRGDVPRGHP